MILRFAKIAALLGGFILIGGLSAYLTMTLIIESEDVVAVPDLTGKDAVYALETLTGLGLNARLKGFEYSAGIARDLVIYQEPSPGAEIKKGREVRIVLSKGAETIAMPDLKGLSETRAQVLLEGDDLVLNHVSRACSSAEKKDLVIAQYPEAGRTVARGTRADVLVGEGTRPEGVKTPLLIGLPLEKAIVAIGKSRLEPGEIKTVRKPGTLKNTVVDQDPPAGHRALQGSAVTVTVNAFIDAREKRGALSEPPPRFFSHRLKPGFLKNHVEIHIERGGRKLELFDDFVKGGEQVRVVVPADGPGTLFLKINGDLVETRPF